MLIKKQWLPFALALSAAGSGAYAATSSGELEVQVGLDQAVELTCTAMNFGRVGFSPGDRGGSSTVFLEPTDPAVSADDATPADHKVPGPMALLDGGAGAAAAVCTFTGSKASAGTPLQIVAQPGTTNLSGADTGAPTVALEGGEVRFRNVDIVAGTIDGSGQGFVHVGGGVTFNNNFVADNFGGYSGTISITLDDGQ